MMTSLLIAKYWQAGVVVAALGFGAVEWHAHNLAEQEKGAALVRNHSLDSTLKSIQAPLARTDTLLVRDTVKVRVAINHVTTMTDTVLRHLTDTVIVKQFVRVADSAAKACTELAHDCAEYRRLTDLKISALQSKLLIAPLMQSSHHWGADLLKVGVGFGLGYLAHR